MEEEDGSPGPGARQSGPADVLSDALAGFLRHTHSIKRPFSAPKPGCIMPEQVRFISVYRIKEKINENVSGK